MGLDISAHSGIDFSSRKDFDDYGAGGLYLIASFINQTDGIKEGVYDIDDSAYHFRAGSYSGYNHWRNQLSNLVLGCPAEEVWSNSDKFNTKPFYELIYFSDCEGFIGPKTSAKLYDDFVNNEEHIKSQLKYINEYGSDDNYFYEKYLEWKEAFRIAKDNGVVAFH